MRLTMIESLTCLVVTGITCSVNESTETITLKKKIQIIILTVLRLNLQRVCLVRRRDNALGQHSSF